MCRSVPLQFLIRNSRPTAYYCIFVKMQETEFRKNHFFHLIICSIIIVILGNWFENQCTNNQNLSLSGNAIEPAEVNTGTTTPSGHRSAQTRPLLFKLMFSYRSLMIATRTNIHPMHRDSIRIGTNGSYWNRVAGRSSI